jgi:hypothetical protein
LGACASLIAPYDDTFDQSLNRLSENTARLLAAAKNGGPESQDNSKETTDYYATSYNTIDRLIQRAQLTRGTVPCPTNATLVEFFKQPTSTTKLPDDHEKLDCREVQLYSVRLFLDQLRYGHKTGGTLNPSEVQALGGALQVSIMGAIQTFIVNKPAK